VKICIIRHGSAVSGAVQDQNRGLTDRGVGQAAGAGRWLAQQRFNNPRILVSPFLRAQQTAQAIADSLKLPLEVMPHLVPDGDVRQVLNDLATQEQDLILVSHLPLVGHLAAMLVDGQLYDQPWSPAECWILQGDLAAAACMSVAAVWYPVLDGL
jgi:phosphohistidine phosphatase